MIHYIHVTGRQHGVTADTASHQAQLLEETMKRAFSESAQCRGVYYQEVRQRPYRVVHSSSSNRRYHLHWPLTKVDLTTRPTDLAGSNDKVKSVIWGALIWLIRRREYSHLRIWAANASRHCCLKNARFSLLLRTMICFWSVKQGRKPLNIYSAHALNILFKTLRI